MTRRWWGGPGFSILLHAALLVVLLYVATQPSQLATTAVVPLQRTKFVYTVTPGLPGAGGGSPSAAAPRPARAPESARVQVAPARMMNVEPPRAAAVPVITPAAVEVLPGAPMAVDGSTVGRGVGSGAGAGRGPGFGPGEGPGAGDVYAAGVGGVSEPTLVYEVKPNYTTDAMRAKIQGAVLMDVVVRADGTVDPRQIRITHSLDPGLDREAVAAVRQWRFRPSLLLGRPVACRVLVELAFTLR